MGGAYFCAEAGISNTVIENQAAYIGGWLSRVRDDGRLIVHAMAQAQRAADLHSQPDSLLRPGSCVNPRDLDDDADGSFGPLLKMAPTLGICPGARVRAIVGGV